MYITMRVIGYVHLFGPGVGGVHHVKKMSWLLHQGIAQIYIKSTPENVHVQGVFVCEMPGSTPNGHRRSG